MDYAKIIPILEGVCHTCDYGKDSRQKAEELFDMMIPLGTSCDDKVAEKALEGIAYIAMGLLQEIREKKWKNANSVYDNLKQVQG